MDPISSLTGPTSGKPNVVQSDANLMEAAQKLEASFLSEMLKAAKFGEPRDTMGGGIGEEQFSSFLRQSQADEMVKAGGIGLAQSLFEALKEEANGSV